MYLSFSYEQMLLTVFAPFEKAYLSKSLTRLFDAVNQLFISPGKSLPGKTELTSLTKTFLRCVHTYVCIDIEEYVDVLTQKS